MTRNILSVLVAAGMVMMTASLANAAVANTKHDLSTGSTAAQKAALGGTDRVCVFCHTPHNASTNVDAPPLWNKNLSAAAGFTPYDSPTIQASGGTILAADMQGQSLACLTCHDGSTSVGQMLYINGAPLTATMTDPAGYTAGVMGNTMAAYVGTTLTGDHPVGFVYDAALQTADNTAGGSLKAPPLPASGVVLFGGQVECATCHNVHDNANTKFLRVSNAGSALCTTCHGN